MLACHWPQGVLYSHRANFLQTFTMAAADALCLRSATCIMAIVPLFHANAWGLAFGAPMFGSKLVLPGQAPAPVRGTKPSCLASSLPLPASCSSACRRTMWLLFGAQILRTKAVLPGQDRDAGPGCKADGRQARTP